MKPGMVELVGVGFPKICCSLVILKDKLESVRNFLSQPTFPCFNCHASHMPGGLGQSEGPRHLF